jgi:multidrug resistance efflux pump
MIFKKFPHSLTAALIIGTFGVWGCTNTKAPNEMLTETEAEIERARELGAQEHAPVELLDAEDKLAKAKTAIDEEQYQQAETILAEAMVDAEHAAIKSRSVKAKSAASTVDEDIETLKNELEKEEEPGENSGVY